MGRWIGETERSRQLGFVALCMILSTAGALGAARARRPASALPGQAGAARVQSGRRTTDCVESAQRDPRAIGCTARPVDAGRSRDERTVRR
jgi:hypothetical protein